ncbi:MAG: hypothetical protein IKD20_04560 [Clostridia bacterium]|nr:hypothetical protein [Clostridia bacterium]MBR7160292.1 hypothetical protein [Clostridia bacterium]
MNSNKRTQGLVRYAMIAAVVLVGILIDTIISASLPVATAIASILTVSAICQIFSLRESIFAGFCFGLYSMIRAIIKPNLLQTLASAEFWTSFINPIVSVLPRVLMGIVIYLVFKAFDKIFSRSDKPIINKYLASALATTSGTITNTVLVLSMMALMKFITQGLLELNIIVTLFSFNFIIELVVAIIGVPLLTWGLRRAFKRGGVQL